MRELANSDNFDFVTSFAPYGASLFALIETQCVKGPWRKDWILPATDAEYLDFLASGEILEHGLCEQANSY